MSNEPKNPGMNLNEFLASLDAAGIKPVSIEIKQSAGLPADNATDVSLGAGRVGPDGVFELSPLQAGDTSPRTPDDEQQPGTCDGLHFKYVIGVDPAVPGSERTCVTVTPPSDSIDEWYREILVQQQDDAKDPKCLGLLECLLSNSPPVEVHGVEAKPFLAVSMRLEGDTLLVESPSGRTSRLQGLAFRHHATEDRSSVG